MNQWTPEQLIGISSVILALAGFIVTAITVILGYRDRQHERRAGYRATLYAKQIEAYDVILAEAISYFDTMPGVLKEQGVRDSGDIGRAIYGSDEHRRIRKVHRKYVTYLPKEVTEALMNFEFSYKDLKPEITRRMRDGGIREELVLVGGGPHVAYSKLIETIRRHVGTDKLTPQILELVAPTTVETAGAPTTVDLRGDVPFIGPRQSGSDPS